MNYVYSQSQPLPVEKMTMEELLGLPPRKLTTAQSQDKQADYQQNTLTSDLNYNKNTSQIMSQGTETDTFELKSIYSLSVNTKPSFFERCKLPSKPKRSTLRLRIYWHKIRSSRKMVLSSVFDDSNDMRYFAEVSLFGKSLVGLMETGASISCIGAQAAIDFLDSKREFKRISSSVHTANRNPQPIIGLIQTSITYKKLTKQITVYIIPSLARNLYLGIDFWNMYNLLPPGLQNSDAKQKSQQIESFMLAQHWNQSTSQRNKDKFRSSLW